MTEITALNTCRRHFHLSSNRKGESQLPHLNLRSGSQLIKHCRSRLAGGGCGVCDCVDALIEIMILGKQIIHIAVVAVGQVYQQRFRIAFNGLDEVSQVERLYRLLNRWM